MKSTLMIFAITGFFLTLWGFLPDVHRSAISIALLRPLTGLMCFLGVIAERRWAKLTFAVVGLIALGSVALHALPGKPGEDLRIYSKNLLDANTEMVAIAEDIRGAGADIVMLQELVEENAHILALLSETFPHQHVCRYSGKKRIAVLSRAPMTNERVCSQNRSMAGARIEVAGKPVWIVSVHVPYPWPAGTPETVAELRGMLEALEGSVVVSGDFNAFPWTGRVQDIVRATNTKLAGPMRRSYVLFGLPLPIDHVLAPGGGRTKLRPRLGSDHWGLLADVTL